MESRVASIKLKFQNKWQSYSNHVNYIVALEKYKQNNSRLNMEEHKGLWSQLKESLELVWIYFKVLVRNTVEYAKDVAKYYPINQFAKIDLLLLKQYLFKNPFKISKKFLMQKGEENVYAYGETPLSTFDIMMRKANLTADDCLFELGCGRGRTCFWAHSIIGCRVVGIEWLPAFIEKAQKVQSQCNVNRIEFRQEDFKKSSLIGATVIYLYGTCLEDEAISKVAENCMELPVGTKIITVSYPLNDYAKEPVFEVMHRFPAQFTWGEADVYIQLRK